MYCELHFDSFINQGQVKIKGGREKGGSKSEEGADSRRLLTEDGAVVLSSWKVIQVTFEQEREQYFRRVGSMCEFPGPNLNEGYSTTCSTSVTEWHLERN